MSGTSLPQHKLYQEARQWERRSRYDPRDSFAYVSALDEVLFDATLRFGEYPQDNSESFSVRLKRWIDNVSREKERQALLILAARIAFIDRRQMLSLCRDAYRRVVGPWISRNVLSLGDQLGEDYELKMRFILRQYALYSVTESFSFSDFLSVNRLSGLAKPTVLGEDPAHVAAILATVPPVPGGTIVFEDFVGTGKQARAVLEQVRKMTPASAPMLFVPLIMLEAGRKELLPLSNGNGVSVEPVLVVDNGECVREDPTQKEPEEFKYIRALVKATAQRVVQSYNKLDDPPKDPFGYGGCGALIVTYHNSPNNTLPLIHHRSPQWSPLFRRLHHSKDGLS